MKTLDAKEIRPMQHLTGQNKISHVLHLNGMQWGQDFLERFARIHGNLEKLGIRGKHSHLSITLNTRNTTASAT